MSWHPFFLFLHETCNFKPLIFNKSSIILQCSLETSSPQEHFLFFPWHSIHIWWSFKQRYQRVFPGLGPFSHIWHRISVRIFETVLFKSSDSRDEAIFQIKPVKRKRNVRNFVYNWKTETSENSTPETTNSELRTEISLIISSVLRVWTWKSPVKLFSLQGSKIQSRRSLSSQRIGQILHKFIMESAIDRASNLCIEMNKIQVLFLLLTSILDVLSISPCLTGWTLQI